MNRRAPISDEAARKGCRDSLISLAGIAVLFALITAFGHLYLHLSKPTTNEPTTEPMKLFVLSKMEFLAIVGVPAAFALAIGVGLTYFVLRRRERRAALWATRS